MPPDVADAIARWQPELAPDEHAPLIRRLVAHYRPADVPAVRQTLAHLSGLVYWADRTGRPVNEAALLNDDVVEDYVAHGLASMAGSTGTTARRVLRRVIAGSRGPLQSRRPGPGFQPTNPPYTADEVDALLLWAQHQPSAVRGQALLALLVLGLGAGLGNRDIAHVRGTDIARDPASGAVLVNVRSGPAPRTVPLLARYETEALRLAEAAGDGWFVNPGVSLRGTGPGPHVHAQSETASPGDGVPPFLTLRARTTWVCHHLAAGTRVDVLAAAGGFKNGNMGARYASLLQPPAADAAIAMLRNA